MTYFITQTIFFETLFLDICRCAFKIKKNSDDVHWNVWTNVKKFYAWNNIFRKRIPIVIFWIIYILVQISFFGTVLGRFTQCFFLIFHRQLTMVVGSFTQPSHRRKASYGPEGTGEPLLLPLPLLFAPLCTDI